MIRTIELGDFLSHSETRLEFDNGVTVFVGQNGAGKSSIIDAITFVLFGQHTRKSNKGLIKRGANQGFAKIEFSVNSKQYQAVRKIDSKGSLAAKFTEQDNGELLEIAAGERKQFGESMTHEIEKVIGLNFEKLKIASIVQQGELNAIIKAKPKEFKELLNAIIGIDKLDVASEAMRAISRDFRESIREEIGYDDTHIDILLRDFQKYKTEIEESKPQKEQLKEKHKQLQKELLELGTKLETETPKIDKINQLEMRKKELQSYVREAIHEIQREISEKERKIRDCEGCFEHLNMKKDYELKMEKVESAVISSQKKIRELSGQIASLNEKQMLATRLQIKNNKCPVCDSIVEKLNPLFQEEHIKQELGNIKELIVLVEKELEMYNKKKIEFSQKIRNVSEAETTLRVHSIKSQDELKQIQEEIRIKKANIQKIPLAIDRDLSEIVQIDSHSRMLFEHIISLERETREFNEHEFLNLKKAINQKQIDLSQTDQQLGAVTQKISKYEEQIIIIQNIILYLKIVKEYVEKLDMIQMNIFNRDGQVATSLRSWALNTISAKSSEYLTSLNTKIQRISLSEKIHDVSITCYSKNEVLDLESLSGGEQVSVALALRLGMARLLGASNLNLMILDEPTTHLDAEHKKSLVNVLSQLSDNTNVVTPMQFIIITHDAEIFEDSNVEKIYKFESTEQGSKVTML